MFKLSIITVLSFSCFFGNAQSPHGKLFFNTYRSASAAGVLGYIEYPSNQMGWIDSTEVKDIVVTNEKLFTIDEDVFAYDLTGFQKVDSIVNLSGDRLAIWNNTLIVASDLQPHLRVYDIANHLSPVFDLDSSKLSDSPIDMMISGDKAFLLYNDHVAVVDMNLQEIIVTATTPHPFPFGGINLFIVDAPGDYAFIDVEYATGALRSSLLKINKNTYTVDSVYHVEGYGNYYHPVVAGEKIYLFEFDSHYDIINDALSIHTISPYPYQQLAVAYDEASTAVFLNFVQQNRIQYYVNGSFYDTLQLPGFLKKAVFLSDWPVGVDEHESVGAVSIYPNPAKVFITLHYELTKDGVVNIQLIDLKGRVVKNLLNDPLTAGEYHLQLNFPKDLPQGIYFVTVSSAGERKSLKIFKE